MILIVKLDPLPISPITQLIQTQMRLLTEMSRNIDKFSCICQTFRIRNTFEQNFSRIPNYAIFFKIDWYNFDEGAYVVTMLI